MPAAGAEIVVRNPATDEVVGRVPDVGREGARAAIDAAAAALPAWRDRTSDERAGRLGRMAELMARDRESLARQLTREQGKPLAEARGEIDYAASFLTWSAEEAGRVHGSIVPGARAGQRILVLKRPVGVCAAITPWNFPAAMVTRKAGPALAAGCTVVVKPAEQTPLTAMALGALAEEAGFPAGVFGVVTGTPEPIADEFFTRTGANGVATVRKVSFTGSTAVGKLLMARAGAHVTRLSLELGGHAPFIVFDDADIGAAVSGAIACKFRNGGQTCICANRFMVQRAVHEEFVARLADGCARLRVGPGDAEGVQIGPLIDDGAVEKVKEHVEDARVHGARLRAGGGMVEPGPGLSARFFAPTVLEGCGPGMLCWREETFGPVAAVASFGTEEEALAMANASPYGLAGYCFTRDGARSMRMAERLECGVVGINDGAPSTARAPFGGVKESGFGREGGSWGLDEYLDVKYVSWEQG